MKIGKETNRYCPKCKKHTVNTISIYKAGKQRKSSLGALATLDALAAA